MVSRTSFRIQQTDENCITYDSGVLATFDQETIAGSEQVEKFTYYGHIHQIIGIGFRSFEIHILDVKWYAAVTQGQRPSIKVAQEWFCRCEQYADKLN